MRSKQKLLGALIGLAVSATGFGEEAKVESTKAAPMISVLPNFYSSVNLRQVTDQASVGDETVGTRSVVQGRYVLGSTFLDGKLAADITFGATKETKTNKIVQRRPYILVSWTPVDTEIVTVNPYADIRLNNGKGTAANLGIYNEVKKEVVTSFGTLTAALSADGQGNFSSRDSEVEVGGLTDENKTKMNLTGADQNKVKADAAGITTEYGIHLGVKEPAKVKGLKLNYIAFADREFAPNMQVTVIEGEERPAMVGYTGTNTAYNEYRLDYAIGATGLTFTNRTFQNFDGVFQARRSTASPKTDDARWTNVAILTKSL
jgi:hypothetical protein